MTASKAKIFTALVIFYSAISLNSHASTGDGVTRDYTQFLDLDRDYSGKGIDPKRNPYNVQALYRNIIDEYLAPIPKVPDIDGYIYGTVDKNRDAYRNELRSLLKSKNIRDEKLSDFDALKESNYSVYWFEPTRTYYDNNSGISNSYLSVLAFDRALFADPLVKEGHAELAKARDTLLTRTQFNPASISEITAALKGKQVSGYADYLDAASNFYSQDYTNATEQFESLEKSPSPWLKETATYMLGRMYLIRSQSAWSGEGDPVGSIDTDLLAQAEKYFTTYLSSYPKGSYAISAQNLLRKIYYLRGDKAAYATAIKAALTSNFEAAHRDKSRVADLHNTILEFYKHFDAPIDYANDSAPVVIFGIVGDVIPTVQTAQQIQAKPERYKAFPGVLPLLEAIIYYRNQRYDEVIGLLGEIPPAQLSMNSKALLARTYGIKGQPEKALTLWHDIQSSHNENAVEFELAYIHADQKDYLGLLRDPGIKDEGILAGFAAYYASTDQLAEAYKATNISKPKHHIVELELIRRYLFTRKYADFVRIYEDAKDTEAFAGAYNAAKRLAKDDGDMQAVMYIANFINTTALDPTTPLIEKKDEGFEGMVGVLKAPDFTRCKPCRDRVSLSDTYPRPYDYYKEIQQYFEKSGQKNELEAEALHRMVECFHAGYRLNNCMWNKIEPNAGKALFKRLHKAYPKSEWTEKTQYYYELDEYYYKPGFMP